MTIATTLEDIRRLLEIQFGDEPDGLHPPISIAEKARLCELLDVESLHSLADLLSWHNGESESATSFMLASFAPLFSSNQIIETHCELMELASLQCGKDEEVVDWDADAEVRPCVWNSKWIPFWRYSVDWAVDFSPTNCGAAGQVIAVDWQDRTTKVYFESLEDLFEKYCAVVRSGKRDFEFVFGGDMRRSVVRESV